MVVVNPCWLHLVFPPAERPAVVFSGVKKVCGMLADIRATQDEMPADSNSRHAALVSRAKLALKNSDESLNKVVKKCFSLAIKELTADADGGILAAAVEQILQEMSACQTTMAPFRTTGVCGTLNFCVDLLTCMKYVSTDPAEIGREQAQQLLEKYCQSFETQRAASLQQEVLGSDAVESLNSVAGMLKDRVASLRTDIWAQLKAENDFDAMKAAACAEGAAGAKDVATYQVKAGKLRNSMLTLGINLGEVDTVIQKLQEKGKQLQEDNANNPIKDTKSAIEALLEPLGNYEDLDVEALNKKLLKQELCNDLPKLYNTLLQKAKSAGASADVVKDAKKAMDKAMLAMATCTALQVLQRSDPKEAESFQKDRLPQYKVKFAALPFHVQEALQTLSLEESG